MNSRPTTFQLLSGAAVIAAAAIFCVLVYQVAAKFDADHDAEEGVTFIRCGAREIPIERPFDIRFESAELPEGYRTDVAEPGYVSVLVMVHTTNESITSRLVHRLRGKSLDDIFKSENVPTGGSAELVPESDLAEVLKDFHDYVSLVDDPGPREISNAALLMCNPSICKVEVGMPLDLQHHATYLLFDVDPHHVADWRKVNWLVRNSIAGICSQEAHS